MSEEMQKERPTDRLAEQSTDRLTGHQTDHLTGRLKSIRDLVRDRYDNNGDPGHDFAHIERVVRLCQYMAREEGLESIELLTAAAYLHDVINVPKNSPDRLKASEMAATEARGLLSHAGFSDDECATVAQIVLEHSYSLGLKPSSIESAILQDADRLDALGAIGVKRMVACGTRMGSKFYNASAPFAADSGRELEDARFMVDHYDVKLLKLVDRLNTSWGKAEGERRTQFMRDFLTQLRCEIEL